jgi:hypothetical protein
MSLASVEVYSKDSKPFGLTFGEWSVRWWQWLLLIPKDRNPAMDPTGQNASIGQLDPNVFFLCQTVEGVTQQPARRIIIPRGRSIFMPILNWISNFYKHGSSEQELIEIARTRINAIGNMQVKLGRKNIPGLEAYRFLSQFFVVEMPTNNILDLPPGKTRFVSDGYWLCTGPILNNITISTFASCSSGMTKIGVDYFVNVI